MSGRWDYIASLEMSVQPMAGSNSSNHTVSDPLERGLYHRGVVDIVGSRCEPIVTAIRIVIRYTRLRGNSRLESTITLALRLISNEIAANASPTASVKIVPRVVALVVADTSLQANELAGEITSPKANIGPTGTVNGLVVG